MINREVISNKLYKQTNRLYLLCVLVFLNIPFIYKFFLHSVIDIHVQCCFVTYIIKTNRIRTRGWLLFSFSHHGKSSTRHGRLHLFNLRIGHDYGHCPFDLCYRYGFELFDRLRHGVEKRVYRIHVF